MPDHFYRFRSASALLDGFHELENQEIYFPTLKELNDPLEGYKDLVWRGDRIVWHNLFRHYVLCLLQSTFLMAVAGKEFTPEMASKIIFHTPNDLPEAPIRKLYASAYEKFFAHSSIPVLIDALASPGKSMRRDELAFYLRLVHSFALSIILELFADRGAQLVTSATGLAELADKTMRSIPRILDVHAPVGDLASALYFINNNMQQQLALIHDLNNEVPDDKRPWLFVARDYPSQYVTDLEQLLYPDWHAACFVTDPTGAAMWGHYGDGHKGICLKFKAKSGHNDEPCLDLYRVNSWSGDENGMVPHYNFVLHPFEAVDYTSAFPEVDFFESIGRLAIPKLNDGWYRGPNGERSEVAARVLTGKDQWHEEYWQRFRASYRTKSAEWSQENEHRIILYSNLDSFDTTEARKLKYRFEDLTGIIFGLRTSTEHKLAAMRIVEKKCLETGREDFEFWQAHYSHGKRQIELAPLRLLKITLPSSAADAAP
ncbi:MAG: DUF2971 domain-containing protein [Methylovirgula sp.]|uniref:DUF2971 domain-containing protein n=1 Tax=Methylovirgula sp. TaxID=1978224 RepID=UPI0030763A2D